MPDRGALRIQSASKPGKDGVVSVADAELFVAARIVLFLIGAAQRRRAHPVGVCGVIALHVSQRHLPNSRRQFLRFQKVGEGAIAAGGDARAKAIYLFPEISHPLPSSGTRPPVVVRELVRQQSRRLDDGERGGLLAVDELRSQLDGQGKIRRVQGEDAAAQSLAGFEEADALAGSRAIARRGQAGGARADDDDVECYSRTISDHGSLRTWRIFSSISRCVAFSPRTRRR